jgi:sirohydrochlorin ferrochelatase
MKRFLSNTHIAILVAAALCCASMANAQSAVKADSSVGVILVAHGADAGWNAPVEALAAQVRSHGVLCGPVGVSFLMGDSAATHRFQDVAADLVRHGAHRIVVVPLLVSSYSGHYDQIRYLAGALDSLDGEMMHHLHMSGIERVTGVPMTVVAALDDSPELASVLAERATALASDRSHRALFLMGHGPNSAEDYAAWMKNLRIVAEQVRRQSGYASVAVELVRDDAPPAVRAEAVTRAREIIGLQHAATNNEVIVVPILMSSGTINQQKLPADLSGTPAVYRGAPLLPDTNLVRWVERRVLEAPAPRR